MNRFNPQASNINISSYKRKPNSSSNPNIYNQEDLNNQLHPTEAEFLTQYSKDIQSATPRSIRSFTIKYRLARNLCEIFLRPRSQPISGDAFNEWHNIDFQAKKLLAKGIVAAMNFEQDDQIFSILNKELQSIFKKSVEMVTYHPNYSFKNSNR